MISEFYWFVDLWDEQLSEMHLLRGKEEERSLHVVCCHYVCVVLSCRSIMIHLLSFVFAEITITSRMLWCRNFGQFLLILRYCFLINFFCFFCRHFVGRPKVFYGIWSNWGLPWNSRLARLKLKPKVVVLVVVTGAEAAAAAVVVVVVVVVFAALYRVSCTPRGPSAKFLVQNGL